MKEIFNIEKSGFHKGEYVGYGDGVWRITKAKFSIGTQRITWVARHREGKHPSIFCQTLKDIGSAIYKLEQSSTDDTTTV